MTWEELEELFRNRKPQKVVIQTGRNGFKMLNEIFKKDVEKEFIQEQAEAIKKDILKEEE